MKPLEKISQFLDQHFIFKNVLLAISIFVILFFVVFNSLSLFTRHGERYVVPNFYGMSLDSAKKAAEPFELQLQIIDSVHVAIKPKGVVLEQYPKMGSYVKKGRHIFLTTNTFTPKRVELPYVVGFSLRQAKNRLLSSGFQLGKISYVADIATFNVLEQAVNGKPVTLKGVITEVGTAVDLVVGLNSKDRTIVIPSVVGLTIEQAKSRLWDKGFNNSKINLDADITNDTYSTAKIYAQLPLGARDASYGEDIELWATASNEKCDTMEYNVAMEIEQYYKDQLRADSIRRGLIDTTAVDSILASFEEQAATTRF